MTKDLTRQEYMRLYMRCKTRGINKGLKEDDLRIFIKCCMDEQIKEGLIGRLTPEQQIKKFVKIMEEPKKPEKKIVYVDVTPRHTRELEDFFVEPKPSKKERLCKFMRGRKVDYPTLMKKLKELEKDD